MSRAYSVAGTRAVNNPTKTLLGLTSATTVRPSIAQIVLGSTATPADNALETIVQRYTAPGTATGVTPSPVDPADPAALASAGQAHTVEPTYTAGAVLLDLPQNQRSTQTWAALTERYQWKLPATASNGIGIQPIHASFTGNVTCTIFFDE